MQDPQSTVLFLGGGRGDFFGSGILFLGGGIFLGFFFGGGGVIFFC